MTDLEMIKKCAEKMGVDYQDQGDSITVNNCRAFIYDPLHDDSQAMALVKKFPSTCIEALNDARWEAINLNEPLDINRAIVECVSKLN